MTVYIVQKLHWEYNDNWFEREGDEPVTAFQSRDDALTSLNLLEDEARREFERGKSYGLSTNPFRTFGGSERTTSLNPDALWASLNEAGILVQQPTDDLYDETWWDALWPRLSTEQRDSVWSLLDHVHFYEVVELEVGCPHTLSLWDEEPER